MKNKIIAITLSLFFILVMVVIKTTYSYYAFKVVGNQTLSTTKITNKGIEINYVGGPEILIDSSQASVTKSITIKNNNATIVDYFLSFEDVINTFTDKTKLTYSFTCTGTGCLERTNYKAPSSANPFTTLIPLTAGTTHTYSLTITYDGTPTEGFSARISATKPNNVLLASTGETDTRFIWSRKATATSISIENAINIPGGSVTWDMSLRGDGSVIASVKSNAIKIQCNGQLYANPNSQFLFYNFSNVTAINSLNLLNTGLVEDMFGMLGANFKVTTLNLSNFNTSNATNFRGLFYYAQGFTSLDLSSFDTSNVTDISLMFSFCNKLTTLNLNGFITDKVTLMMNVFEGCTLLSNLNISTFNTENVTDMFRMFKDCSSITSLDLSHFDTSQVTSFSTMFYGCGSLVSINVSTWDTSSVNGSMGSMFFNCSSLTSIDLSSFDTSGVTHMDGMFYNCANLTVIDLGSFDTSSLIYTEYMFTSCIRLTTINFDIASFSLAQANSTMFSGIVSGITITVRDAAAQTWITARLTDAGKTGNVIIV